MTAVVSGNISYLPPGGTRIKFTKVFADAAALGPESSHLNGLVTQIESLRKPGLGMSVTNQIATHVPDSATGQGWRLCVYIKLANGVIIKVCIEHADPDADVNALYTGLVAQGIRGPLGELPDSFVKANFESVLYK